MNIHHYSAPIGIIEIETDGYSITKLKPLRKKPATLLKSENQVIRKACGQLGEYFAGERQQFDLPISTQGTDFQQTVWKQLTEIPYGKTISYRQLAQSIDNPKACRAVGNANGKNPVSIIIPCHRVIASDGSLGGYASGLEIKKQLLDMEKKCTFA